MLGKPVLVYQAGFADRSLPPVFDPLHLGRLQLGVSENLVRPLENPSEPPVTMEMVPSSYLPPLPRGARFTLARPALGPATPTGSISFGAVVHPFHHSLRVFLVTAVFGRPQGPAAPGDAWALAVVVRAGGVNDPGTRESRIAVTLQSAVPLETGVRVVRMNTVGGAPVGTPEPFPAGAGAGPPFPQHVHNWLFSIEGNEPLVRLEVLVNRKRRAGHAAIQARLVPHVSGREHEEQRWFDHPFLDVANGPIDAVGFSLGIANGNGPVSATVRDFRIYRLASRNPLLRLSSLVAMGAGAALLFGAVRRLLRVRADRP